MSRVWRDDSDPELRHDWRILIIPALFLLGCLLEIWWFG